jgi:thimet oligopeptidase
MTSPSRILRQALGLLLPVALVVPAWAKPADLAPFQTQAAANRMALVLPTYPLNPDEVKAQAESAIKTADAALTALAAQDPAKATFASTFAAYDAATARVSDAYAVINTVAESALDKTMRDTANEMSVKLQEWSVGLDYRADLYQALKAFADTKPKLDAQEQRLVDDQMRAYRRPA